MGTDGRASRVSARRVSGSRFSVVRVSSSFVDGKRPKVKRLIVGVILSSLIFQVFHLAEHTAQMAQWVRFPNRGAWMSPWATEVALLFGRIEPSRISEMTTQMQRGMELLHLSGNLIFLVGAIGLFALVRSVPGAHCWARFGVVAQSLHVLEHVVLTATLFSTGRAVGLSTGFGTFDGTRLSTYRVWWHGLVNLLATGLCTLAVLAWRRSGEAAVPARSPARQRLRPLVATLATLTVPLVLGFTFGQPVQATPIRQLASAAAPVDQARSGQLGSNETHFVDVAAEVGLDMRHGAFAWDVTMDPVAMMGGGVCWLDVDGDGWLDLFVTNTWSNGEWGLWDASGSLPTTRLYQNAGGVFEDASVRWNSDLEARANGCVAADFNNDGHTDLYVTTSRSNLMLWNQDGEGFIEGAVDAGTDLYGWHTGVAAGDLNGDGWIDLVVAGYADLTKAISDATTGFPNTFTPVPDVVLLNQGSSDGAPTRFEAADGLLSGEQALPQYGLGVVLVDVDDDHDLDLYIANDTQPNQLYLNSPLDEDAKSPAGVVNFTFVEVGDAAGVADPNSGMGIGVGAIDNNATLDLVVTNLEGQGHASMYRRDADVVKFDAQPESGLDSGPLRDLGLTQTGWGLSVGDLDLDGDLDAVIASGAIPIESLRGSAESLEYFAGDGMGSFANESSIVGLDDVQHRNGRSVTFVDYDNDGDLDVLVSSIGEPMVLLQNRGTTGHWLTVDAGSVEPGMRVRAELDDGSVLERRALTGSSWLSSEDPRIHLGLGSATSIRRLVVTRLDGSVEVFDDVAVDQVVHLAPRDLPPDC